MEDSTSPLMPDIRLHPHTQQVTPVGDDVVEHALEHIGGGQHGHDGEEGDKQLLGQQLLHGQPGEVGEGQVHDADEQGAHHVQGKELPVGAVVRGKNAEIAPLALTFGGQNDSSFLIFHLDF